MTNTESRPVSLTVGFRPMGTTQFCMEKMNSLVANSDEKKYDAHCSLFVLKLNKGTDQSLKFLSAFKSITKETWKWIINSNCEDFWLKGTLCGLGVGNNINKFFALSIHERFADVHEVLVRMIHEIKMRTKIKFRCKPSEKAFEIWHDSTLIGSVENYWFGRQHMTIAHTNGCIRSIRDEQDGKRRIYMCIKQVLRYYRECINEVCLIKNTQPFISVGKDLVKFPE